MVLVEMRRLGDGTVIEFLALAEKCAPTVAPQTMAAVVNVESTYNPFAIGVVGGRLVRQPKNSGEAIATARQLETDGWNFSLGVAQVNRYNLPKFQINYEQAFDACTNLRVGSKILEECYLRALKIVPEPQAALQAALSCYYSGNFKRGFKPDVLGKPSYVQKVLVSAGVTPRAIAVVPSLPLKSGRKPQIDKAASTPDPAIPKFISPGSPDLSSDNAAVLLRPSIDGLAKARPMVTDAEAGLAESESRNVTSDRPTAVNTTIVF
jgi:type IV secretion system protein VirB1